jgi:hypothetical protein
MYIYICIYIHTSTAINCAIEESTVGSRKKEILPHDRFICDHMKKEDMLIVSVEGNDIALKPNILTIINMLVLLSCTTNRFVSFIIIVFNSFTYTFLAGPQYKHLIRSDIESDWTLRITNLGKYFLDSKCPIGLNCLCWVCIFRVENSFCNAYVVILFK